MKWLSLDDATAWKQRNGDALMAMPEVHAVGVGLDRSAPPDRPAGYAVYVSVLPGSAAKVRQIVGDEDVFIDEGEMGVPEAAPAPVPVASPAEASVDRGCDPPRPDIDDFAGKADVAALDYFRGKHRPACGGISLGNIIDVEPGTFGGVLERGNTRLAITNYHVLMKLADGSLAPGAAAMQPAMEDGGATASDQIGNVDQCFLKGVGATTASVDVATIVIGDSMRWVADIGWCAGLNAGTIGMHVRKSGRTTGWTQSNISQIADIKLNYGILGIKEFKDVFVVARYTDGGDSGSLVFDDDNRCVALHFGGNATLMTSYCIPIARCLAALTANTQVASAHIAFITMYKGTDGNLQGLFIADDGHPTLLYLNRNQWTWIKESSVPFTGIAAGNLMGQARLVSISNVLIDNKYFNSAVLYAWDNRVECYVQSLVDYTWFPLYVPISVKVDTLSEVGWKWSRFQYLHDQVIFYWQMLIVALGDGIPSFIYDARHYGNIYYWTTFQQSNPFTWPESLRFSKATLGNSHNDNLEIILLHRTEKCFYLMYAEYKTGDWNWVGKLLPGANQLTFKDMSARSGNASQLQLICLSEGGKPYLYYSDTSNTWKYPGAFTVPATLTFSRVVTGHGNNGNCHAILLSAKADEVGRPYAIWQDASTGNWHLAEFDNLPPTFRFQTVAVERGYNNNLEVIGSSVNGGRPLRMWQDANNGNWWMSGEFPFRKDIAVTVKNSKALPGV